MVSGAPRIFDRHVSARAFDVRLLRHALRAVTSVRRIAGSGRDRMRPGAERARPCLGRPAVSGLSERQARIRRGLASTDQVRSASLLEQDGKRDRETAAPQFGFGVRPEPTTRFNPMRPDHAAAGRRPSRGGRDRRAAPPTKRRSRSATRSGDHAGHGPFQRSSAGPVRGVAWPAATLAVFDRGYRSRSHATARRAGLTTVIVRGRQPRGHARPAAAPRSGPLLLRAETVPGRRPGGEQAQDIATGALGGSSTTFLLAFARHRRCSSAPSSSSTRSRCTVAHAHAEFAHAAHPRSRRAGRSRAPCFSSAVIGLLGVAVRARCSGVGLAYRAAALMEALGVALPQAALVFAPRTTVVARRRRDS